MKIIYLSDPTNAIKPDRDILYSLKKKAEVKAIDIRKFDISKDMKKAIKNVMNCDLFLFHGQLGKFNRLTHYTIIENLKLLLEGTNAKKVLWFFDKIWMDKMVLLLEFYNSVDYIFLSDETWLKRFETYKIFPLHPAASEKKIKGKFKKELACDMGFYEAMYGVR